jgi:hypothetical protein
MSIVKRTPEAVMLRIYCPQCTYDINVNLSTQIIDGASRYPVSHAHLHGNPPHLLIMYVDKEYQVRGFEVSDTITVERPRQVTPLSAIVLLKIPPRLKRTAMAMLKLHQASPEEVSRITGKTPNVESQYLGMMFQLGYLERTKLHRFYQYRIPGSSDES